MKNFLKNKSRVYSDFITSALAVLLFSAFMALAGSANSQDRDPFSPSSVGSIKNNFTKKEASVKVSNNDEVTPDARELKPLTSSKISAYKIIGTITSKKKNIAAIKAVNGLDYFAFEGDFFGNEGGKIDKISMEGVTVKINNEKILLPVSNKNEVITE